MLIETNRLLVRSLCESDADALWAVKTDPMVMKFCQNYLEYGLRREQTLDYVRNFIRYEAQGDWDTWRCYAVADKETGEVMGTLSFGKQPMLHEYALGWELMERFTKKGYASEAAEAFAEWFCRENNVDYLIVVMDVDNPASYRSAQKCGFRLFERRTIYNHRYQDYCDYYYFRRYYSGSAITNRFYGDEPYEGRSGDEIDHAYQMPFEV
ncbi:MAG: GNAT family N-acetyltransferase [Oscillospiraceae bacterium]